MAKKTQIILALAIICVCSVARAETYGPVSFLLPPEWECSLEKSSDVCLSAAEKSAIALVVTYKRKTPEDSLTYYKDQLGVPRQIKSGEVVTLSQVKLVHEITLNGQKWLEALHHNSEIQGYYTDYLVTVAGQYAVLISITVKDSLYPSALVALKPTVDSLRISLPQEQESTTQQTLPQSTQAPAINGNRPQHYNRKHLLYLGAGLLLALFLLIYAIMA